MNIFLKPLVMIFPSLDKVEYFTYFLPSPPSRKTGYREKEFDQITKEAIAKGYTILELNTRANASGVWIILKLRKTNPFSGNSLDEYEHIETAEGLYQINEEHND